MKLYIREESFPLIIQKLNEVHQRFCCNLLQPSERKIFIRAVELLSIKKHIYARFIQIAEREMGGKFIDFYEQETGGGVHKMTRGNRGPKQIDEMQKGWKLEDSAYDEFIPWTFSQESELLVSMNEETKKK